MKRFTLYSRSSVLIFSLILSGLCGALMVGYNLRTVGKRKVVVPLVIITLLGNGVVMQVVNNFVSNSLLRFVIPNLIAGVVLSYPIWDSYLNMDKDEFNEKAVWTPVIVAIVLYGGLTALYMFRS